MRYRVGRWHLSLTIVIMLLGFLLSTSFSVQQSKEDRPGNRKDNLIKFIYKQRREQKRLSAQLNDVRDELGQIDMERTDSEGALIAYNEKLSSLKARAGLTEARGPGISVALGDAQKLPPDVEDPDSYLIHDYDLQIIVNALWRGGAEAISINGERFVAGTGIRSAGSTILINSKPQGGPYEIVAIGDPDELKEALEDDSDASLLLGGYAGQYGLLVQVEEAKKFDVPGYAGGTGMTAGGEG